MRKVQLTSNTTKNKNMKSGTRNGNDESSDKWHWDKDPRYRIAATFQKGKEKTEVESEKGEGRDDNTGISR